MCGDSSQTQSAQRKILVQQWILRRDRNKTPRVDRQWEVQIWRSSVAVPITLLKVKLFPWPPKFPLYPFCLVFLYCSESQASHRSMWSLYVPIYRSVVGWESLKYYGKQKSAGFRIIPAKVNIPNNIRISQLLWDYDKGIFTWQLHLQTQPFKHSYVISNNARWSRQNYKTTNLHI